MDKPWGIETILDLKGCNPAYITDPKRIRNFIEVLVKDIDMVPIADLYLLYCKTTDPQKWGWSLCQMIQDSNITAHFCDFDASAYMNVFSCKEYDPETVKTLVQWFFDPQKIKTTIVNRG